MRSNVAVMVNSVFYVSDRHQKMPIIFVLNGPTEGSACIASNWRKTQCSKTSIIQEGLSLMRKKLNRALKPFYPAIIEQQMRLAYESLVKDHKKIVQNYEQKIKSNQKLIEDQDRHIQAYQEKNQIKDQLIARHQKMFEKLKQQFPETRELLDKMDL
jgi:hypothetical protein